MWRLRTPGCAAAVRPLRMITRIRRLITQITTGLGQFTPEEREQIDLAIDVVRRHRAVMLGMRRDRGGRARQLVRARS